MCLVEVESLRTITKAQLAELAEEEADPSPDQIPETE